MLLNEVPPFSFPLTVINKKNALWIFDLIIDRGQDNASLAVLFLCFSVDLG